jgi:hypothetical protein
MPARLLREGILSSDRVDQLDAASEVFYRRLMSKVDDHGLYDARPAILRSSLYPLRVDRVREADISRWIAACEKAGLIALYTHEGKPYLQMLDTRWTARSEPKFPLPTTENKCAQLKTGATLDVFGDGDVVEDDKARRRAAFDAKAIELPEDVPRESWVLWCEDRAARKKPITERGAQMQLQKLHEYRAQGFSAKEVIENSIAGGYQGLFAPTRKGAQLQTTAHSGDADETQRYLAEQRQHQRAAPPPEILAKVGKTVKVVQ